MPERAGLRVCCDVGGLGPDPNGPRPGRPVRAGPRRKPGPAVGPDPLAADTALERAEGILGGSLVPGGDPVIPKRGAHGVVVEEFGPLAEGSKAPAPSTAPGPSDACRAGVPNAAGMGTVTNGLVRRDLRMAVSRLGGRVQAVSSAWPRWQVFGSCGEQVRAYWAQDDFVGGAVLLGLNAELLDSGERRVAATSDLIIAANQVVADTWRNRSKTKSLFHTERMWRPTPESTRPRCLRTWNCVVQSSVSPARSTTALICACLKLSRTGEFRFCSLARRIPFRAGAVRRLPATAQRLLGRPEAFRSSTWVPPTDRRGYRALWR